MPLFSLLIDLSWCGYRIQRRFFPYDYQIIQEIHIDEPERTKLLELGSHSPRSTGSYSLSQLPREVSRHTGFDFDSPGYESFFASQFGVQAPQKAWDVAKRSSRFQAPKNGTRK